jgi:hypothetical protein
MTVAELIRDKKLNAKEQQKKYTNPSEAWYWWDGYIKALEELESVTKD